jgi:hypothetical protein
MFSSTRHQSPFGDSPLEEGISLKFQTIPLYHDSTIEAVLVVVSNGVSILDDLELFAHSLRGLEEVEF